MRPQWEGQWDPRDFQSKVQQSWQKLRGKLRGGWAVLIVLVGILLIRTIAGAVVIVPAGHRAVIFSRFSGVLETQMGEGFHVLVPWVWEPIKYSVQRQTWTVTVRENESGQATGNEPELTALTQDGQHVSLEVSVVYHPDPTHVWRLHQRVGPSYVSQVIRPQARSICRMVVSQYPVTDVYSGSREVIQQKIGEELASALALWDITLDELLLRNVEFSDEFQQAIEAKQVAIQDYERMQYELEAADREQEQTVIKAEGEFESLRLQGKALRENPMVLNYEYAKRVAPAVEGIVTGKATSPPSVPATGGR